MEYKAIDLGLPSGLKWSDRNVGAEKETDYGKYFQWGDVVGYTDASHSTWDSCPGNGCYSSFNRDSIAAWDAETLSDGGLKPDFDAATVNMGSKWRMPTHKDCLELFKNTNYEYAEIDGVKGGKFISKANPSKYIFLPFAGFAANDSFGFWGRAGDIWSSSVDSDFSERAYRVGTYEAGCDDYIGLRYIALPVRGVVKNNMTVNEVKDNTATNEIISPYFEDGVFAGVRVTLGGEDFVIAPKDYNDGKEMTWHYATFVLEENGLETFNHKQACLIAAYHKEIDEILIQNGGDAFEYNQHYWTCEELQYHSAYEYFVPGAVSISPKAFKVRVRLIKNLKEE